MNIDIDYDFPYQKNKDGYKIIPEGTTYDENELMVLPNGKYANHGLYYDTKSGLNIIYDPFEPRPIAQILQGLPDE